MGNCTSCGYVTCHNRKGNKLEDNEMAHLNRTPCVRTVRISASGCQNKERHFPNYLEMFIWEWISNKPTTQYLDVTKKFRSPVVYYYTSSFFFETWMGLNLVIILLVIYLSRSPPWTATPLFMSPPSTIASSFSRVITLPTLFMVYFLASSGIIPYHNWDLLVYLQTILRTPLAFFHQNLNRLRFLLS